MRLINTKTTLLEEFLGEDVPEYAILSHTWGEGEVSFQDYMKGVHKNKKGYRKIQKTCEIAAEANIAYAWVDTCCIDKKSSAELSEAINSMYRYYADSKICYAYLSDLSRDGDIAKDLKSCRWFTRGWTLQELIAPEKVLFLDARWNKRGFKTTITSELSAITKIDAKLLRNERTPADFCIAQKMSWAAQRKTSRIEDSAYCLLGLFDLSMPLLYGEGKKAFRRLQLEIIRSTPDLSIFAWNLPDKDRVISPVDADLQLSGVLATSPALFEGCNEYLGTQQGGYRECAVTNVGIKIHARVFGRQLSLKGARGYILPLNCTSSGRTLALRLRQVGYDEYVRANPFSLFQYDEGTVQTTRPAERHLLLTVSKQDVSPESEILPARRKHVLKIGAEPTVLPMNPWPADRYDIEDQLFFIAGDRTQDYAMIDVNFLIQPPKTSQNASKWMRCKFIALGWSRTDPTGAQFGIVDEEEYAAEIRAVQPSITEWDRDSRILAYMLNRYKIPKTTTARFLLPRADWVAHITFMANPTLDFNISLNPTWVIHFSCTFWRSTSEHRWQSVLEPVLSAEEWNETA